MSAVYGSILDGWYYVYWRPRLRLYPMVVVWTVGNRIGSRWNRNEGLSYLTDLTGLGFIDHVN